MYEGRGAGAGPTASAVVADLIDIARGTVRPVFGIPAAELVRLPGLPMSEHSCPYYLRLLVIDKPGVIADVAAALRDENISMDSVIQRGRAQGEGERVRVVTIAPAHKEPKTHGATTRHPP